MSWQTSTVTAKTIELSLIVHTQNWNEMQKETQSSE